MGILGTVIIGFCAGFIASRIMSARTGVLGSVLLGVLGAFVGSWISEKVGLDLPFHSYYLRELIVSILGAILVIFLGRVAGA